MPWWKTSCCFPDTPAVSSSGVQTCQFYLAVISHFPWWSRQEISLTLFHLILRFVPALRPTRLLFNSSWLGALIPGITWAWKSFSNRLTSLPLPWLRIITDVETLPVTNRSPSGSTSSKPAQKKISEVCFHRKKPSWKEDAKKAAVCPETLQQADCL